MQTWYHKQIVSSHPLTQSIYWQHASKLSLVVMKTWKHLATNTGIQWTISPHIQWLGPSKQLTALHDNTALPVAEVQQVRGLWICCKHRGSVYTTCGSRWSPRPKVHPLISRGWERARPFLTMYTHWGMQHSFSPFLSLKGRRNTLTQLEPPWIRFQRDSYRGKKLLSKCKGPFIVLQVKVLVAHWTTSVSLGPKAIWKTVKLKIELLKL